MYFIVNSMTSIEKASLTLESASLMEVILRHRSAIRLMAEELSLPGIEADDLMGEAFIALLESQNFGELWENVVFEAMQNFIFKELTIRADLESLQTSEYRLTLPDQGLSPEELALRVELMAMIQKKLDALPPRHAEVVLESVLDGRSFKEIAEKIQALTPDAKQIREGALSRSRVGQMFKNASRRLENSILPLLRSAYGREDDPYGLRGVPYVQAYIQRSRK